MDEEYSANYSEDYSEDYYSTEASLIIPWFWIDDVLWYTPPLTSLILAVPIHCFIIYSLWNAKNVSKIYSRLIILLCVTDIAAAFLNSTVALFYLVPWGESEIAAQINFYVNKGAVICFSFSAFHIAALSIYWKHAASKNLLFESFMLVLISISTSIYMFLIILEIFQAYFILEVVYQAWWYIHGFFWISLISVSFVCFVIALRFSSNQLSSRTVQLLRTMSIGLCLQTVYNLICYLLSVWEAYLSADTSYDLHYRRVYLAYIGIMGLSPFFKALALGFSLRNFLYVKKSRVQVVQPAQSSMNRPILTASSSLMYK